MENKKFTINGRLISSKDKTPIGGLKVEAWDKDLLIDDLLGSSVTDSNGNFTITFRKKYYKEIILDRKPDIYFRILKEESSSAGVRRIKAVLE